MKKFTKTQWKAMRVITKPDTMRAMVKADNDGDMFIWVRIQRSSRMGESVQAISVSERFASVNEPI